MNTLQDPASCRTDLRLGVTHRAMKDAIFLKKWPKNHPKFVKKYPPGTPQKTCSMGKEAGGRLPTGLPIFWGLLSGREKSQGGDHGSDKRAIFLPFFENRPRHGFTNPSIRDINFFSRRRRLVPHFLIARWVIIYKSRVFKWHLCLIWTLEFSKNFEKN